MKNTIIAYKPLTIAGESMFNELKSLIFICFTAFEIDF